MEASQEEVIRETKIPKDSTRREILCRDTLAQGRVVNGVSVGSNNRARKESERRGQQENIHECCETAVT